MEKETKKEEVYTNMDQVRKKFLPEDYKRREELKREGVCPHCEGTGKYRLGLYKRGEDEKR